MAGLDVGQERGGGKQGGRLHHKKRRVSIRIDMTPMVDVAFLLLVFFMVTTVFRAPQAMEVNLPPDDAQVEVPEASVLTLYVNSEESFFTRQADGALVPLERKDLAATLTERARANQDLIILVKLHRKVHYETMVSVMDELELANLQRFSLLPMTEEDLLLLGEGS
jgi:biopolymer transport protein ExbD